MEIALAVLTALAAILPAIIAIWKRKEAKNDALSTHSVSELHAGTDRVRKTPPAL